VEVEHAERRGETELNPEAMAMILSAALGFGPMLPFHLGFGMLPLMFDEYDSSSDSEDGSMCPDCGEYH
jgi:hypothetical protein